jgi:hypothetical protein
VAGTTATACWGGGDKEKAELMARMGIVGGADEAPERAVEEVEESKGADGELDLALRKRMQKLLDDVQMPLELQVDFAIKYTKAGRAEQLAAALHLWEDTVEALRGHRWAVRKGLDEELVLEARAKALGAAEALLEATGDVASYKGQPLVELLGEPEPKET